MSGLLDAATDPDLVVSRAAQVLLAGGVVLVPTDTVYGIAAVARYRGAVSRLAALKDRSSGVPVAVLVADLAQAAAIGRLGARETAAAEAFWPGPLTLVIPARPHQSRSAGDDTIGVRCPDSDLIRRVAAKTGPIATTSANHHGSATPPTAAAAAAALDGPVDLVIDGGRCVGSPSTVVSMGPPLVVHRQGSISPADLERVAR